MKNVIRIVALGAAAAASALSASAQQPAAAAQDPAAAAKAACTDLYTKWRDNYKGSAEQQKTAAQAGEEFMAKCPNDEYLSYVQKWMTKYRAAVADVQLQESYNTALQRQDWRNVLAYGKQLAAKDPENLTLQLNMAIAGSSSKDKGLFADSISAGRRAIALAEAGKADAYTAEQWKAIPFASNRAELIAFLNSLLAFYSLDTSPNDSVTYFLKAVQSQGRYSKDPNSYYNLALAYQKVEYAPMAKDYSDNCAGKDLTDECKVKLDRLNLVVDRIIDAMARAVALADADPAARGKKAEWLTQLEGFYKFRNNDKTDGLNELVASIQSKPLLLKENQTMPTPTPTTAPATNATPSGASGSSVSATTPAAGGATQPAATPASNTTAKPADAKPAPKPAANGAKPIAERRPARGAEVTSSARP